MVLSENTIIDLEDTARFESGRTRKLGNNNDRNLDRLVSNSSGYKTMNNLLSLKNSSIFSIVSETTLAMCANTLGS